MGVKGFDFERRAIGLRKQGNAAIGHGAVHVHEEQFDLAGSALFERMGNFRKTGQ